jgi:chromosome segregation ATPase
VTLVTGLLAGAGVAYRKLRKDLTDKDEKIKELNTGIATRDAKFARIKSELEDALIHSKELQSRLPEAALELAEKEWSDRNDERMNRALAAWRQQEGEAISQVMFKRAEWAAAHAVQEQRASGLVTAEAYGIAAVSLWPKNRNALKLLEDIDSTMKDEAQPWPPYIKALVEFEERAFETFDRDLEADPWWNEQWR